uniref:GATA-type domain-containing protein n=1 Tax=Lotus japonicus TaxID=34305 RepID=I3SNU5_LOTJA|nr:unknown [Lotus japonicus]
MGKQGPCYHCGVTSTPLWRNGPPEKPTLCNACGSRWRTKGTLVNYTPLHARPETDDYEDQKVFRVKSISLNKNKEGKPLKRKQNHDNLVSGGVAPYYNQGFPKVVDEDTSNRSSSGSAISNSESCAASSLFLDSLNFAEESSDQDLLLDVPSNSSFPQAELLCPTLSFGAQASTSSSSAYSHLVHR